MVQGWATGIRKSLWLIGCLVIVACSATSQPFDHSNNAMRPSSIPTVSPFPSAGRQASERDQSTTPPDGSATMHYNNGAIVKVGLLLPLSGRSEPVGKALRDAGVLALFDKYATLPSGQTHPRVELVIKDTGDTPEMARQAAAEAVREGAVLLLGPLFSTSVEALKPLAKTGKISVISFSNNAEVAGDGVYVMGFDPAEQTRRIAYYTFGQGKNRMAAMTPNDEYGRQVSTAARAVAKLLNRKLDPLINYTSQARTIEESVNRLATEGSTGARVAFDALFLPEGSDALGVILNALADQNINAQTVQFVGTGLWDDRDLIRKYNLKGAWFASSPPDRYEAFEQRFVNSYGYKPPRVASLSYDAVALAATMVTSGGDFSRDAITDPNGYNGPANGIFRFRRNGTIERGLAVMRVDAGGLTVIDPAPVTFQP